jgi:hypothetical protein
MEHPDQRLFDDDLRAVAFRAGAIRGQWDRPAGALLPADLAWPFVILWIAAARRDDAPDRFFVRLDAAGYRSVPPTGTFWDPATKAALEFARRPKGKPDSRVAKVFRTDWESGRAFYHPTIASALRVIRSGPASSRISCGLRTTRSLTT